ncbi:MAG TPA: thiamine-phosphate kinase [Gemmatimonadaceae bacterium]|nr:thiamine-phosphate kinase [Gemmatimonadaceae bacterium]
MSEWTPAGRRRAIEPRVPRESKFYPHTPLGPGREFDTIRRLLERWGPNARRIGDDAAILTTLGERAVVTSIDTSIENVHFRRDWMSPADIGYRTAVSALSDLAAMGARPTGILAALTVPDSWLSSLDAIGDGIGEASARCKAPIIGGDLTRGEVLSLTFSVLGTARDLLCRTGSRPGDRIYVTGKLGGSITALQDHLEGREPSAEAQRRFARPVPRIEESIWLSERGATAAIDISDGLAADLAHVAAASKVIISIELDRIPLFGGVTPIDAAQSGEEYELVVTSPHDLDENEFADRFDLLLTRVGFVTSGDPAVILTDNGETIDSPPSFEHFPH